MRCHDGKSVPWWRLALCLVFCSLLSACSKAQPPDTASAGGKAGAGTPQSAPLEGPNLALRLKVGDKFPLQKTVVTTLVQPGPNGQERSTARKEFLLTITVEAMPVDGPHAGQKQMGVKFHTVRFSRELNGETLEFDSRTAQEPIPQVVRPYHGLVGNSFSFWLGQDNQVEGIVDFDKFVKRCLKGVPQERFEEVWNNLAMQTGADGIASFVDDSIGLLPKSRVVVGDSWMVTRRSQQPIAMVCKSRYTLQHMDGQQAEVSILGEILPSAILLDSVPGAVQKNLSMSVRGGQATGSCTIDLRTGLPIHSQVEQFVDMHVKLQSGAEFVQHKQTITTIRAFPAMPPASDDDGPLAANEFIDTRPRQGGAGVDDDGNDTRIAQPPRRLPQR